MLYQAKHKLANLIWHRTKKVANSFFAHGKMRLKYCILNDPAAQTSLELLLGGPLSPQRVGSDARPYTLQLARFTGSKCFDEVHS